MTKLRKHMSLLIVIRSFDGDVNLGGPLFCFSTGVGCGGTGFHLIHHRHHSITQHNTILGINTLILILTKLHIDEIVGLENRGYRQ